MNIQILYAGAALLALIGSGCIIAFVVWVMRARGLDAVANKGSKAWESVAEAYEKQMVQLQADVAALRKQLADAMVENGSWRERNDRLVGLNLQLQTTNSQQAGQISMAQKTNNDQAEQIVRLQARVTELERELVFLREHAAAGTGIKAEEENAVARTRRKPAI